MTDLNNLFSGLFAELDVEILPAFPTAEVPCGKAQTIDNNSISRISRISRDNSDDPELDARKNETEISDPKFHFEKNFSREGICKKSAGNAGSAGRGVNTPAGTDTYLFPQKEDKVGNAGRDLRPAGAPSSPSAPHSISPAQVQAGVERELRMLAGKGHTGPDAHRDAVAIVRSKIRNSPKLVPQQTGATHCYVCDERETSQRSLMPVLSGVPGRHIWIHPGCHEEHVRRVDQAVDEIMRAAGYGAAVSARGVA